MGRPASTRETWADYSSTLRSATEPIDDVPEFGVRDQRDPEWAQHQRVLITSNAVSRRRSLRGASYVDTGRNGYSATFAAAYTVRATQGAPVSAPCTWDEIERGAVEPTSFTLRNRPARIKKVGDLWADLLRHGRSLKRPYDKLLKMAGAGSLITERRRSPMARG